MQTQDHATPSWKTRAARILHPLERWLDRFKYRAAPNPIIEPYLGYATPEQVVLRGRVLSAVREGQPKPHHGKWTNFKQMVSLFATDEVVGITVSADGTEAVTDEEGYFTLLLPRPDASGWHTVEAHLPDHPKARVLLHALVPDPSARFGVISDIDDTMLQTGAFSLARNLWTSLTGNVLTRHVFPDAVALIDRLHDTRNPVYYVSSSPWNLYRFLTAIFERHELPMLRILTDRGTEYCGKAEQHDYQLYLALNDIDHTKTKAKSPQTNGICERFHKTILDEFYKVTFRKKLYTDLEGLQHDLDEWLVYYNEQRTHQGKMCCGRTPLATREDGKRIWKEKFVA